MSFCSIIIQGWYFVSQELNNRYLKANFHQQILNFHFKQEPIQPLFEIYCLQFVYYQ
jgi:hypothetical protein